MNDRDIVLHDRVPRNPIEEVIDAHFEEDIKRLGGGDKANPRQDMAGLVTADAVILNMRAEELGYGECLGKAIPGENNVARADCRAKAASMRKSI